MSDSESSDNFVLLPDQMYENSIGSDNLNDINDNDNEDLSAEQYLREMEKILRKIKKREFRKSNFNKGMD